MAYFERLGAAIKRIREERRLSQYELSDLAGVAQARISGYETERYSPSIANLDRLLQAFSVDPGDLWLAIQAETGDRRADRALRFRLAQTAEGIDAAPARKYAVVELVEGQDGDDQMLPGGVTLVDLTTAMTDAAERGLRRTKDASGEVQKGTGSGSVGD